MYQVIEKISTYTPLGIRFWDPVLDNQIRDALTVTARPEFSPRPVITAYRTRSGVYAFNGLSNMRDIEHGSSRADSVSSPPTSHSFVIEVRDERRRYVDVGFKVDLPLSYKGLFLSNLPSSPPSGSPKGFNLYSAATRTPPALVTAVRGELFAIAADKPAAHALVRITTEDGFSWFGLADEQGRFAAVMPYPTLIDGIGGSPTANNRKPLYEQTWNLAIEVLFEPTHLQELPGSRMKDYKSILNQSQAQIWPISPKKGGLPIANQHVQLEFGKEVILKTAGLSKLLVSPAASPP